MAVSFQPHQATMGPNVFILHSREGPQLSTAAQGSFHRSRCAPAPLGIKDVSPKQTECLVFCTRVKTPEFVGGHQWGRVLPLRGRGAEERGKSTALFFHRVTSKLSYPRQGIYIFCHALLSKNILLKPGDLWK